MGHREESIGKSISNCGLRIAEGIEHGAWSMEHGVKDLIWLIEAI